MSSLLFYQKPVALNREQHKSARIGVIADYGFARNANSVVLNTVEFVEVCKEYPVVFAKTGDRYTPVALLGLRENENLFVNGEGKWDARYIPAFVRRYPFVLAETGGAELTVCVDEASPAFNAAAGQPLFDEAGRNTPFLDNALGFLNAFQAEVKRTESFASRLASLGLLTEMSAKAELADGRKLLLNGLYVVDEAKLQGLGQSEIQALVKSGDAGWIYAHLISLTNVSRLTDRMPPAP